MVTQQWYMKKCVLKKDLNIHFIIFILFEISIIKKLINAFIQQGCIKLISDSEDFYIDTKKWINKCCYFDIFIYQRTLKKIFHGLHKNITISRTSVFNIDNNSHQMFFAQTNYFRLISEGSCDAEDWINCAEN